VNTDNTNTNAGIDAETDAYLDKAERRALQRYLAPGISIAVQSSRPSVENESPEKLRSVDFNHSGMAIHSQHVFKIGDTLSLVISDGENRAEDVQCFVCNRAKTAQGYRCGLHFVDHAENAKTTKASLVAIEQKLFMALG